MLVEKSELRLIEAAELLRVEQDHRQLEIGNEWIQILAPVTTIEYAVAAIDQNSKNSAQAVSRSLKIRSRWLRIATFILEQRKA